MNERPEVGKTYKHYKKGTIYTVVRLARDCDDATIDMVVYEDDKGNCWVRKVSEWVRPVADTNEVRFAPC